MASRALPPPPGDDSLAEPAQKSTNATKSNVETETEVVQALQDHVSVNAKDSMRALQDHLHKLHLEKKLDRTPSISTPSGSVSVVLSGASAEGTDNPKTRHYHHDGHHKPVPATANEIIRSDAETLGKSSIVPGQTTRTSADTMTVVPILEARNSMGAPQSDLLMNGSLNGSGTATARPSMAQPKNKKSKKDDSDDSDDSENSSSDEGKMSKKKKKKLKKKQKREMMRMQGMGMMGGGGGMGPYAMQQAQAQYYYNYCCQQQAYQNQNSGYNQKVCYQDLKITPMKSAAFTAQNVDLFENGGKSACYPCQAAGDNVSEDEDELEDGVAFSYKPRPNGRTEMTVTVEPKKQPWLTMMRFGFRPVVNCTAPPCYLSPNNCPGLQFQDCGQAQLINNCYASPCLQNAPPFPTLDQIRNSHQHGQQKNGHKRRSHITKIEDIDRPSHTSNINFRPSVPAVLMDKKDSLPPVLSDSNATSEL